MSEKCPVCDGELWYDGERDEPPFLTCHGKCKSTWDRKVLDLAHETAAKREAEAVAEAIRPLIGVQPAVLQMMRRNGFVFTDVGSEPGNWQHLAFTLYSEIAEIDSKLRALLEADRGN